MTQMRNAAALMKRDMNTLLLDLSMSYKLAQEAKEQGHREDSITLDYVSKLYHNTAGLVSAMSSYIQVMENFTSDEEDVIFSMPYDELRITKEF